MEAVPTHKIYNVIKQMAEKDYPINLLCEIGKVSRSGYYKWLKRQVSPSSKQGKKIRSK